MGTIAPRRVLAVSLGSPHPLPIAAIPLPTPDRVCLVTGANGFLGTHLCDAFRRRGWTVRGLVRDTERRPFSEDGVELFRGDLPDDLDPAAFEGAHVVVHAAYMSRHTTLEEARRVNEDGSRRVREAARAAGARFVFVSSTGAHPESLSYYGQSKLAVERTLSPEEDLILRPGLILGDGGLFSRISGALRGVGAVPVFDGGRQRIQTVHVEDLANAIASAVEQERTGCYVLAHPEGIELRSLFREIGRRMGRKVRLVPLPATPLLWGLRAAESMGLRLPLTSENVLGARSLRVQPSESDLEVLGIELRDTASSLDDLVDTGSD